MGAPTEAEIREAIAARRHTSSQSVEVPQEGEAPLSAALRGIAEEYAGPATSAAWAVLDAIDYDWGDSVGQGDDDAIWGDLRPTEARRLRELVQSAIAKIVPECEAIIINAVTAAAMQFAAEYPDAPRATEAVTA